MPAKPPTQSRIWSDGLEETIDGPLWTQDLYGSRERYLGPVHGYAGNMIPLMHGFDWLTEAQRIRVRKAVPRTLSERLALRPGGNLACRGRARFRAKSLPALPRGSRHGDDVCGRAVHAPELEALLVEGGKFTWAAGPLAKGSESLPRHRRQRLCLAQAFSAHRRSDLARACAFVRDDGDRPMPRGTRPFRAWSLFVLDRRLGPCRLPVGLPDHRAAFPDYRRVLSVSRKHGR